MKESLSPLKDYSYELPSRLIANAPVEPRDSSRLLFCDPGSRDLRDERFSSLPDLLPQGSLLVLNETKVVPARISLRKKTGGKVETLFYVNTWDKDKDGIDGISDRKLSIGDDLYLDETLLCSVVSQNENVFGFALRIDPERFLDALGRRGTAPLPKYIKNPLLSEARLRERYQTTFAKNPGSVAAPTASLHFTQELLEKLTARGISVAKLTLHVGAGTFAPVTEREMRSGELHKERFFIPKETLAAIRKAKEDGRPVIPVGTTSLRAVESIEGIDTDIDIENDTRLFIRKPYRFKIADGLVTNFHVPESSLMCLVDAFLDYKRYPKGILEVYRHAIKREYRFYSFGDAMLIL